MIVVIEMSLILLTTVLGKDDPRRVMKLATNHD